MIPGRDIGHFKKYGYLRGTQANRIRIIVASLAVAWTIGCGALYMAKVQREETRAGKAIASADHFFLRKQDKVEEIRKKREVLLKELQMEAREKSIGKSASD